MIRIRRMDQADAQAAGSVHLATVLHTYRGIMPDAYLATLTAENLTARMIKRLEKGIISFVAEAEGGEIVGFADGGPQRYGDPTHPGELYSVYVHPMCQGRGAGRALVAAVLQGLRQARLCPAQVVVARQNRAARRFYERLGAQVIREASFQVGGADIPDVTYSLQ